MQDSSYTNQVASATLSRLGRAALVYAQKLGRRVLPVRPGGKKPIINDWPRLATTDADQIATWWTECPDANIGLLMGEGWFVLDKDPRNGGDETLARIVDEHGPLPRTTEAATPSGGGHYVFRIPPGIRVRNGKIGSGLDIKGEAGQVVAAPSKTPTGQYRWVLAPWDVPPADAPAWLLEWLTRAPVPSTTTISQERGYFPPATPAVLAEAREALAEHGPAVEGQGGDEHTFVAAAILVNDFALTPEEARPLLAEWNEECQPPWSESDLDAKLLGGARYGKLPFGYRRKPVIELVAGRLAEIATQAEAALVHAGVQVFSRGGALVRPVLEEVDAAHGRRTKVARLAELDATYARDLLSRHARFQRFDARKNEHVTSDPPLDVAQTMLARVGEWTFPALAGVITTPTMRPDGSILDAAGFDPATRLLLMGPPPMPAIPEAPTRDDAARALALLVDLLSEFPFVDDASRSVALSGILTPVVRGAFAVAPGHGVSASTPGTGKSFLWDCSAAISIGQPMPVMAAGRTEEESEKRLGAAVITGQPVVALDNVNGGIGGDAFCQIIERPVVDVRILGLSKLVRVESRSTVYITGNNLQVLGDATRRVLLARLDAAMERPELRQFKCNPVATVLGDRGRYVAAALTIVRAYHVAGRPGLALRLGSFEGWSDTVRSALIWLGCADPVATMEQARAEDPLLALLRSTLGTWAAHLGTGRAKWRTAADVLRIAQTFDPAATHEPFKEALLAVSSNRGHPDSRTLGKWLARHKGRPVDGLRLDCESDAHGSRWWVERNAA